DRVEVDAHGRVRVVDLKTGTRKPTKSEMRRHGQLGAYQVAVEHGGFSGVGSVAGGAALLQLGKAAGGSTTLQEQVPLADDDEPEWARRLLTDTADAMAAGHVVATPGSQCGTCQVKDSCPARPEGRRW
ncbi:MAG: RecB family exonuclease, partial [Dermatophilaceae bacterium]